MATLAAGSSDRGARNKTAQTKGQLCTDLGTQRGILLMFLMISTPPPPTTPLLIKLLITSGCYRRQGDIPQVLSAARPSRPENLHRDESPPFDRPLESQPVFFSFLFCFFFTACKWLLSFPPTTATAAAITQRPSPIVGPPLWFALQGVAAAPPPPPLFFFLFFFFSSCLEMRTRLEPLGSFTRYCYVSKPIN